MMRAQTLVMFCLPCAAVLGCGGRSVGPGSGSGDGTGGATAPTDSVSATGAGDGTHTEEDDVDGTDGDSAGAMIPPAPTCEEGFTPCLWDTPAGSDEPYAWLCQWLNTDTTSCGECRHRCEEYGAGKCTEGKCDPGLQPCIPADPSLANCAEACGSVGETCVADAACSGSVIGYTARQGDDVDTILATCGRLNTAGYMTGFDLGCNDPIPWDFEDSNGRTLVGILCCCTQD